LRHEIHRQPWSQGGEREGNAALGFPKERAKMEKAAKEMKQQW
jgi:hypothetical protein